MIGIVVALLALLAVTPFPAGPALAADESALVRRVQLTIHVCDVGNAGTDNGMWASLGPYHRSKMNYPRADFERADEFTYDLLLHGVERLYDIQRLMIYKYGSDGVCIDRVRLYVNNRMIYTLDRMQWLDNDTYDYRQLTISHSELRAHPYWQSWIAPQVNTALWDDELSHRAAAAVGTALDNTGGNTYHWKWGSTASPWQQWVAISKYDHNRIKVTLPKMKFECDGDLCPDADYKASFRIRFSCAGGVVTATGEGWSASRTSGSFGYSNQLAGATVENIQRAAEMMAASLKNYRFATCPTIVVDEYGVGFVF